MNITSTRLQTRQTQAFSPLSKSEADYAPSDSVTFGMSRSTKRKLITGATMAGGAALGSVLTANATSSLVGTGAKVFGGVSGALAGAAVVGIAGGIIAGALSEDKGFGGLAAAYGGAILGAAAGGIGGGIAGAALGTGAGNVLGYAAGAIAGGVVGGFTAAGMLK